MIPILFEHEETNFSSNGLGRLAECTSCIPVEERNGIKELTLTYPTTGRMFDKLIVGRIVYTTHDSTQDPEPYDIYSITATNDGFCEVKAAHISYRLNNTVLKPFEASSCAEVFSKINPMSLNNNPFTFITDKSATGAFTLKEPRSVRSILGGSEGSILDVYGKAEYEFRKFTVYHRLNRGEKRGSIRYGKNLLTLVHELDGSSSFDAVVPYWIDSDGNNLVMLSSPILVLNGTNTERCVPMNMSDDFDEKPTQAQLKEKAQAKFNGEEPWVIKENLKITYAQLWESKEFEALALFERVRLCDIVEFIDTNGMRAEMKIIRVEYDSLNERYISIELGEPKRNVFDQIQSDIDSSVNNVFRTVSELPTKSNMDRAIEEATELIRGGKGGHILMVTDANDKPQEFLIMDTEDIATAQKVWRWNLNGLGYSSTGYNGTYELAMTNQGKINASMITVGVLLASIIKAGILSDDAGLNSWNMETGEFKTKSIECSAFFKVIGGNGSMLKIPFNTDGTSYIEISQDNPFKVIVADTTHGWYRTFEINNSTGLTISDNYTDSVSELSSTGLYSHDMQLNEANYKATGFTFDQGSNIHHEISAMKFQFNNGVEKVVANGNGKFDFSAGDIDVSNGEVRRHGLPCAYSDTTNIIHFKWENVGGTLKLGVYVDTSFIGYMTLSQ